MEPFGPENCVLSLLLKKFGMPVIQNCKRGTYKIFFKQNNTVLTGIGFNGYIYLLQMNKPLDVVFKIDETNGTAIKLLASCN